MERIINLIKEKNWNEILNYTKCLCDDERFSTITMLKNIDIDIDILKKEGSNLEGKARVAFYENRQQISAFLNYFLLTCVRNYDDLKKLETERENFTYKPYYSFFSTNNFEPLIIFYKLFPPNYLNRLIKEISKEKFRNINFKILWKLYENSWIEFDEDTFVRILFDLQGFDNDHFEDSEFLIANPKMINHVFSKFYKYEIPILDLIKAKTIDYSNGLSAKANVYWTEVFKILIKNNSFQDRLIVSNLLESLLNNWKKPHLDWHVRLLALFHPTTEELIENQSTLFSIIGTGQPSLINFAIQNIKAIYKDKKFDNEGFILNVPVLFTNEKAVKSILIVLDIIEDLISNSVKIDLEYREQICLLLMQTDTKVQEKAANILNKYFNDIDLNAIVTPFASYLKQNTRELLKVENTELENQELVIHVEKTYQIIETFSNWDEILFHIGTCIRTKSARDIDVFFESLIQLQFEIPTNYEQQLKPYTKQLFNKSWEIATMLIFSQFIECWIKNIKNDFINKNYNPIPFLAKKAKMVLIKLEKKNTLPFLSTPTHEPFYVHPKILLQRILQYQAVGAKVDLEDLIVACNRIILIELAGDYKKELNSLSGYYSDALHYFFGATDQINFTNDTLPLWTQITRIKNPNGVFSVFDKTKASNYPTVVQPFILDFKNDKDANKYANEYRLIIGENWNYNWYNKEKMKKQETIYYNTASSDKASRVDIAYQFSLNPNYLDPLLCRYIPSCSKGFDVDDFESCLYPMQFILENQLYLFDSGWIYVAACLLFEKKISRDLASEYIHLAISRKENLEYLVLILRKLINDKYAPVNRFIEYLDKPNNSEQIKQFQLKVVSNCILTFDKENLPINSKKIIQYYKELITILNVEQEEVLTNKLLEFKK